MPTSDVNTPGILICLILERTLQAIPDNGNQQEKAKYDFQGMSLKTFGIRNAHVACLQEKRGQANVMQSIVQPGQGVSK
jgi:hypothetical protein